MSWEDTTRRQQQRFSTGFDDTQNSYGDKGWEQNSGLNQQPPRQYSGWQQPQEYGQYSNQQHSGQDHSSPKNPRDLRSNMMLSRHNDRLQQKGMPPLTKEDFELFRKCNSEAMYNITFPLTALFCGGIFYAGRRNIFKPRWFYYAGAFTVAMIAGRVNLLSRFQDRLVHSNSKSPLANEIRKLRGMIVEESTQETDNQMDSFNFEQNWANPNDDFTDSPDLHKDSANSKPTVSYEELQQRNRSNFKHF